MIGNKIMIFQTDHAVVSVIITMTIEVNVLYFAYMQNEILKGNVFKKKFSWETKSVTSISLERVTKVFVIWIELLSVKVSFYDDMIRDW